MCYRSTHFQRNTMMCAITPRNASVGRAILDVNPKQSFASRRQSIASHRLRRLDQRIHPIRAQPVGLGGGHAPLEHGLTGGVR